jgi:hypothetical protein
MWDLKESHLKVEKWIVHYVKGNCKFRIKYFSKNTNNLVGYVYFDQVGDVDEYKSTFGYMFHLKSGVII